MNAGSSVAPNPNNAPKGLTASTPANTAMGVLGGSISNLQERIGQLREKLGPVLLPPRPEAARENHEGSPIPLVDDIYRQTDRVDNLVADVIDLLERLGC